MRFLDQVAWRRQVGRQFPEQLIGTTVHTAIDSMVSMILLPLYQPIPTRHKIEFPCPEEAGWQGGGGIRISRQFIALFRLLHEVFHQSQILLFF